MEGGGGMEGWRGEGGGGVKEGCNATVMRMLGCERRYLRQDSGDYRGHRDSESVGADERSHVTAAHDENPRMTHASV